MESINCVVAFSPVDVYKVVSTSLRNPVPAPECPTGLGRGRGRPEIKVVTVMTHGEPRHNRRKAGGACPMAGAWENTTAELEWKGNTWREDTPVCANPCLSSQPSEEENMCFSIDLWPLPTPTPPFFLILLFPFIGKGCRYRLDSFTLCFNYLQH